MPFALYGLTENDDDLEFVLFAVVAIKESNCTVAIDDQCFLSIAAHALLLPA